MQSRASRRSCKSNLSLVKIQGAQEHRVPDSLGDVKSPAQFPCVCGFAAVGGKEPSLRSFCFMFMTEENVVLGCGKALSPQAEVCLLWCYGAGAAGGCAPYAWATAGRSEAAPVRPSGLVWSRYQSPEIPVCWIRLPRGFYGENVMFTFCFVQNWIRIVGQYIRGHCKLN